MPSAEWRKSYGSVEISWLDERAIWDALKRYVEELKRRPEVAGVVVFGSFAAGKALPGSDVDILLILYRSDEPFLSRIPRYLPDRFPVPVEVFPYTLEEIARGQPLAREALRTGMILWLPPEAREKLRELIGDKD